MDAGRWRTLTAVIATISVFGTTMGLTLPLLSLILEQQGHGRTLIGLSAATPSLAIFIAAFVTPRLIAHFGPRRYLLWCLAGNAVTLLLLPAFPNVWLWFPIRFAMGWAISGLFIASESWINQVVDDAHRGRVVSLYTTILSLGFVVGPGILSLTGTAQPWLPFLLAAGFNLLAVAPLCLPGLVLPPSGHQAGQRPVLSFFRLAPLLLTAVFVAAFADGAAMALLPVYAVRLHLPEAAAALTVAAIIAGGICLQLPIGWAADRGNRLHIMLACAVIALLASALPPFVVGSPLLWPVLFIWGGVLIGLYTMALVLMGQRFSGPDLVSGNAAMGLTWGLGGLFGPAAAGLLMDLYDPHGLMLALGGGGALFILVYAAGRRA